MTIASRAWAGAVVLALLGPAAAAAQPPRNPFAELFGREPARTGRQFTAVQFRSTADGRIGQTLRAGFEAPDQVIPEGLSGSADAALLVEHISDRVVLGAHSRYSYHEFRKAPAFGAPGVDVGASAEFKATTRLAFHGAGQFVRSPFFRALWLTADQAGTMTPTDRTGILLMRNDTIEGRAGVTSNYSKRSSLSLTGTIRETNFELQPQFSSALVGARAEWRRQMTRDLGVRAAYGRDELRSYGPEGDLLYVNELLDIGVDYGRSFSLARRTSFTFGTATAMLRDQQRGRHFRLNGNLVFEHRFQRTWAARLSARRGSDFLPGFRAPVLTDSAHLSLDGFLAKRLVLNAYATGGRGEVGFNDDREFTSYAGNAKLSMAMTRHLAVFTQYIYYHHQSPPQPETLFVPRGARHSIGVGVQAFIPIYDKDRVPRDPR